MSSISGVLSSGLSTPKAPHPTMASQGDQREETIRAGSKNHKSTLSISW